MTTIAWDGTRLAADSQTTDAGNVVSIGRKKIVVFGSGVAAAFAGKCNDQRKVFNWIEQGMKWPAPSFEGQAIVVPRRGRAFTVDPEAGDPYHTSFRYIAIGSGASIAYGALASGASATAAVRAAIRHDIYSGGRVASFKLR